MNHIENNKSTRRPSRGVGEFGDLFEVRVQGLPSNCHECEVKNFLEAAGVVLNVRILYSSQGISTGQAIGCYTTTAAGLTAVRVLNNVEIRVGIPVSISKRLIPRFLGIFVTLTSISLTEEEVLGKIGDLTPAVIAAEFSSKWLLTPEGKRRKFMMKLEYWTNRAAANAIKVLTRFGRIKWARDTAVRFDTASRIEYDPTTPPPPTPPTWRGRMSTRAALKDTKKMEKEKPPAAPPCHPELSEEGAEPCQGKCIACNYREMCDHLCRSLDL